jgi:hypothetical protein
MAQSLDDLEAKLIAWQEQQLEEVADIVMYLEDEILDMNRLQLLQGENSKGHMVGFYKDPTIEKKKMKGQEYRFVTLHDSGDHFDSMYINHEDNGGEEFSIFAEEIYPDTKPGGSLVDRYGQRIYGLNEANTKILAAKVQKKLQESFRRKMGIK